MHDLRGDIWSFGVILGLTNIHFSESLRLNRVDDLNSIYKLKENCIYRKPVMTSCFYSDDDIGRSDFKLFKYSKYLFVAFLVICKRNAVDQSFVDMSMTEASCLYFTMFIPQ